MKSLDKYISEAGGFFGNTKTSKTDLVMDWIKTYMPSILNEHDSIKTDDNIICISNNNNYNIYRIGNKNDSALDGMPPVKFILETKQKILPGYLIYRCDIEKFGFPLNIGDFKRLEINNLKSTSRREFQNMLKMINDAKSIKSLRFGSRGMINKINKVLDGQEFKLFKRDFDTLSIYTSHFDKIEFNQNIHINDIMLLNDSLNSNKKLKIISLPICKNIQFEDKYTYNEIIEMLSDYIPNPNMKDVSVRYFYHGDKELEDIKNIILGKK